jgi:signal transduction histidine kinase
MGWGFSVIKSNEAVKKADKESDVVNKDLKKANKELQLLNEELSKNNEVYKQFFDNPLNGFVSYKIITDNKGEPADFVYLITERKKAEDEIIKLNMDLSQRVEELTTLNNLLPMSVVITQDKDCKTMYANPIMEELLDISPGSNISLSASPNEKPNFTAYFNDRELNPEDFPMQKAIATGKPVYGSEYDIIRHDGKVLNFYGHAVPLFDEKGNVRGAIGAFDEISDRRKAEKKLERTMEELKRSNQELEQFAYVASHDLQEPLRMVSSFTQLLKDQYEDKLDGSALEYINFAVDGAQRMQLLINDLLAYSRVTTKVDEFEEIDLEKVLDEVLFNLELVIEDNQAVIFRESLPHIRADFGQLVRVFQNIIGNALKYRSEKSPQIHISVQMEDENWLFKVEDNGIGIELNYFEEIFKIFRRLHNRDEYNGTGIGLAITKRIIERHGGNIWVESEPGKGSTFYFTIPLNKNSFFKNNF